MPLASVGRFHDTHEFKNLDRWEPDSDKDFVLCDPWAVRLLLFPRGPGLSISSHHSGMRPRSALADCGRRPGIHRAPGKMRHGSRARWNNARGALHQRSGMTVQLFPRKRTAGLVLVHDYRFQTSTGKEEIVLNELRPGDSC